MDFFVYIFALQHFMHLCYTLTSHNITVCSYKCFLWCENLSFCPWEVLCYRRHVRQLRTSSKATSRRSCGTSHSCQSSQRQDPYRRIRHTNWPEAGHLLDGCSWWCLLPIHWWHQVSLLSDKIFRFLFLFWQSHDRADFNITVNAKMMRSPWRYEFWLELFDKILNHLFSNCNIFLRNLSV